VTQCNHEGIGLPGCSTCDPRARRATRRLKILCDVDGVLADFTGLILDYVQNNVGLYYRAEAVDKWDSLAALGLSERWPHFRAQCDALGLCRSMRPLPGAAAFYAALRTIGTVKVCTTPMTAAWLTQRAEWLEEFGVPLAEQIQVHDKADLTGAWDILIDDKPENCDAFVKAGGRAFLIAAPYNARRVTPYPRGTHADCLAWLRGLT
jgi:5'(3')-deoxyribonucleotidase